MQLTKALKKIKQYKWQYHVTYCDEMICEVSFGGCWRGLVTDGTVKSGTIYDLHEKYFGYRMDDIKTAFVDVLSFEKKQIHKGIVGQKPSVENTSLDCSCPYASCRHFCENYILSPETKDLDSELMGLKENICTDDRFLIMVISNCEYIEDCTEKALENFDFTEFTRESYSNYKVFSERISQLIKDSISYFAAPCVRLSNNLESTGFSVTHETC